jgi:O-antigen/teichoic acid export membrane protein
VGSVAQGLLSRFGRFVPYLYTFGAEFLVVAALALTLKLAGLYWGAAGFTVYTLFRRVIAFSLPVVTLGLDVSMPRYIAISFGKSAVETSAYLQGALLLCAGSGIVIIFMVLIAGGKVAEFAFGSADRVDWLPPLAAMLIGYSFYVLVFSFWRGALRVVRSSIVYVLSFCVVPVLVVGLTARDVLQGMVQIGGGALCVALACFPWRRLVRVPASIVLRRGLELVRYGAPRLVGSAALLLLFALPAIHATRQHSLQLAGVLAFGVTVLGTLGSAVGPVGTILLPRASRFASEGNLAALKPEMRRWYLLLALGGGLATALLVAMADQVLGFFVPGDFSQYLPAFRIMMLGILPFMSFSLSRHIVDARGGLAHNSTNSLLALAIYLLLSFLLSSRDWQEKGISEAMALSVSLAVLAFATQIRVSAAMRVQKGHHA